MTYYLHPVCAVLALLALLYKLSALRRCPTDPALRALCAVLAFSGASFVLAQPVVWSHIDHLLNYPNIAALLAQCCVILLITSEQVLLAHWNHPPAQARRSGRLRIAAASAILAVLIAVFLTLNPRDQRPEGFTLYYVHRPLYGLYLLLYIATYTYGQIEVARRSRQYAALSHRPWLRRGLNLIAAGATVTLGYSTVRLTDIIAVPLRLNMAGWEPIAWICGDVGALLTFVGWTMPAWGPRASFIRHHIRTYRRYRQLTPLWQALRKAAPSIELPLAAGTLRERLSPQTLEFLLYRRVIEIRDGQLALRDLYNPAVAEEARQLGRATGLQGPELEAVAEAAQIAAALHHGPGTDSARQPQVSPQGVNGTDYAHETDWLIAVSLAFTHSPVVQAAAVTPEPLHP
ncbi:MAB_1171c family putative transporter [Streptomyces sp. NPDC003710]